MKLSTDGLEHLVNEGKGEAEGVENFLQQEAILHGLGRN